MAINIQGAVSSVGADVDSTSKGIIVQNPKTLTQIGYAAQAALIDPGSVTGSVLARRIAASTSNRAEVSQVTPLFTDTFNYTAQDTARWQNTLTTFSVAYSAGYMQINSAAVTTSSATAVIRSYGMWPIPTEGALIFRLLGQFTQAPQANCTTELGFLFATGTTAPTDGVFFRYDATGTLKGVINYNGTEVTSSALIAPSANIAHQWLIVLDQGHAEFWIDGVLQAQISSPTSNGQPLMSSSVQVAIRMYHAGTSPSLANIFKVSDTDLWQTDGNINRPAAFERAGAGMLGYQGVSGMTMGSTSNYANNANPTAAVPTNTTAALGTGLGGQFWETATLATNTDGVICSFSNPSATVNLSGRKLVITGYRWMSMVQTVLAGGPFIYQCGLSFGHTNVSHATSEGAASKAPRRIPVGLYALPATAAVGTLGANFDHQFASPVVVNPGEFVAMTVKNIGTVGTSGTIAHSIAFDSHWD